MDNESKETNEPIEETKVQENVANNVKEKEVKESKAKKESKKKEKETKKKEKKEPKENQQEKFEKTKVTKNKADLGKRVLMHSILAVISVVTIAVVSIFILKSVYDPPEIAAENYIKIIDAKDVSKIMNMIDAKAGVAFEKCEQDATKFEEEYKKVTDEEANKYAETRRLKYEETMKNIKTLNDDYKVTFKNTEQPEQIANNLYKVKTNYNISTMGMDLDMSIDLVIYKGKVVCEYKK